ncbi:MAG TPA: Lsr2 family protein [Candidatus Corynebacterium avicola]|uniref:Lsr2 family protein n=1 Tax=Candidatus Corynebacterium avicola TaxID=2838527 RepID=A0A9D1RTW3_9CORY|nr:Lsr2 family protein [Candidatus Corynebacterium avicola]
MARKEIVQFYDDLDKTPLSADEVNVVEFAYQGTTYVLDLSEENAQKFASDLESYISHATKVSKNTGRGRQRSASTGAKSDPNRNRRIREWAREQGHEVSTRGQIPHELIAAYEAANPSDR